jgi:hypothetical protein
MKIIFILLVLPIIAARRLCPGVPYINMTIACRTACGTKLMYDLCIDAMRRGGIDPSPSHTEETTVYAILVGNQTSESYMDTMDALTTQLQENTSLSGPEKEAYDGCLDDYIAASNSIDYIDIVNLSNCFFSGLDDEYRKGMRSLDSCRDRMLAPWIHVPPLYPMVERDRNNVFLAYLLGKLLGI